jgi:hypothetical protein
MIYAVVKDNRVINRIRLDPELLAYPDTDPRKFKPNEGEELIPNADQAKIGDTWNGSAFITPAE